MTARLTILFAVICLTEFGIQAEEAKEQPQDVLRVFVFDASSKPATANATGRYEWRKFGKDELLAMMCDECRAKIPPSQITAKLAAPIAGEKTGVAYLCPQCGELVWKVNGKEVSLAGDKGRLSVKDLEAIVQITAELNKPH